MPPLYCYYGDDFTGSTDVLEQMAGNGVPSVLFLAPPTPAQLDSFAHCQAIGLAGEARSRTPKWMSSHLRASLSTLGKLSPRFVHYKVCSTFDSSPGRGSIGRALEIGRDTFTATRTVPIVVGAPHLGRYLAFGQLFVTADGDVRRIDRHPALAHHPATPMRESDLRLHLARQTSLPIGLVDLRAFQNGTVAEDFRVQGDAGAAAILLDGLDAEMLRRTGELLWNLSEDAQPLFTIGSSGLTAALIAYWRSVGMLPAQTPSAVGAGAVEQLLVLSGSCSAATTRQILWAKDHGYELLELNAAALAGGGSEAKDAALEQALSHVRSGRNTVLYTALGAPKGKVPGEKLGQALGRILLELVREAGIRRVVLCGGDTSSHAVQQLGFTALTYSAALTPGAPLCRAHAGATTGLDGLELVLKGGQIGPPDFFDFVRKGYAT